MTIWKALAAASMLTALSQPALAQSGDARPVAITVDANRTVGTLPPVWRFFGADEPNYATMKDGRKLLVELGKLQSGEVYFRAHNLLSTGDGTPAFKWGSTNAYTETKDGKPVYDWTVVDRIIDTYLARGHPPLSADRLHARGDVDRARRHAVSASLAAGLRLQTDRDRLDLSAQGVTRSGANSSINGRCTTSNATAAPRSRAGTSRSGTSRIRPSTGRARPRSSTSCTTVAIAAVRRALPTARVGGPDVAGPGGTFMDGFLESRVVGHELRDRRDRHADRFPVVPCQGQADLRRRPCAHGHRHPSARRWTAASRRCCRCRRSPANPIVIGESDPEGCAACPGPQNAYRNGTMYSSYTAASFARIWELAAEAQGQSRGRAVLVVRVRGPALVRGLSPALDQRRRPAGAQRVSPVREARAETRIAATSNAQVPLEQMMADGVRGDADVGTLATRTADGKLAVLLWHYHDDDVAGPDAQIRISSNGLRRAPPRGNRCGGSIRAMPTPLPHGRRWARRSRPTPHNTPRWRRRRGCRPKASASRPARAAPRSTCGSRGRASRSSCSTPSKRHGGGAV